MLKENPVDQKQTENLADIRNARLRTLKKI